jgi:hypothetical protein
MKKEELIQVRCSDLEKKKIKTAADQAGLTMSNYILMSLEKQEFTLNLFGRVEDKMESFSDKFETGLYLIKEDIEKVLADKIQNKRGMKLINIIDSFKERMNLSNYKIGDLLTYKNETVYIVNFNNFVDEFHIQNIKTGTIGQYNSSDSQLETLLKGLVEVQRRA